MQSLLARVLSTVGLGLLLVACSDADRQEQVKRYNYWMAKMANPPVIDATNMNGFWQLTDEGYLYKDRYDAGFNSALARNLKPTGQFLLIKDGKFINGRVRLGCPEIADDPNPEHFYLDWLIPLGYNAEKPETSVSLNPQGLLETVWLVEPTRWAELGHTANELKPAHLIRGNGEKPRENVRNALVDYKVLVTEATPSLLEFMYVQPGAGRSTKGGVHTVIEQYKPADPKELTEFLKSSHALAGCPKRQTVAPQPDARPPGLGPVR